MKKWTHLQMKAHINTWKFHWNILTITDVLRQKKKTYVTAEMFQWSFHVLMCAFQQEFSSFFPIRVSSFFSYICVTHTYRIGCINYCGIFQKHYLPQHFLEYAWDSIKTYDISNQYHLSTKIIIMNANFKKLINIIYLYKYIFKINVVTLISIHALQII